VQKKNILDFQQNQVFLKKKIDEHISWILTPVLKILSFAP